MKLHLVFYPIFQLLKVFCLLIVFLVIGKFLFCIYHWNSFSSLDITDQIGIFTHGFRLDMAVSAYILGVLLIVQIIHHGFKLSNNFWGNFSKAIFGLLIFIVSILYILDLELFRTWGFHLDNTPLKYLDHPKEMLASAGSSPIGLLVFILVAYWLLAVLLFRKINLIYPLRLWKQVFVSLGIHLLFAALLIIPLRGGVQLAPINQSSAYFSSNDFANQAAINPIFNFLHSILKNTKGTNPFVYMSNQLANNLVFPANKPNNAYEFFKIQKPNILLITWESLTSKALEPSFTDNQEVLPNLKKYMSEGLYFSNAYASGDRSEKGLVAILSGYPAQPIASIMTVPQKSRKLPHLAKILGGNGYSTRWYYGGEPEFANIKSYMTGAFDKIITKENFTEPEVVNTKWGANDSLVYNRLKTDLSSLKQPFFVNYFTLSSHEPFEIDGYKKLKTNTETEKYLNALHYADHHFGKFIEYAKKQTWYPNTVILVVADHGHRLPVSKNKIDDFHIPILVFGGAINAKNIQINKVVSQTSIAKYFLESLQLNSEEFKWSNNLNISNKGNAYFSFKNGFGVVTDSSSVLFNNDTKKIIQQSGKSPKGALEYGKAYVQLSYADFLSK
jgi:phosphoglycerol transferase MdoB-like AlkP superfamily enzyme